MMDVLDEAELPTPGAVGLRNPGEEIKTLKYALPDGTDR